MSIKVPSWIGKETHLNQIVTISFLVKLVPSIACCRPFLYLRENKCTIDKLGKSSYNLFISIIFTKYLPLMGTLYSPNFNSFTDPTHTMKGLHSEHVLGNVTEKFTIISKSHIHFLE